MPRYINDRVPGRKEHRLPSQEIEIIEAREILASKETCKILEGRKTDRKYQILIMGNPD